MTDDLDYAAGLFDGEGCVSLSMTRHSNAGVLQVSVSMNGAPVIDWLQETFGGMIYPHSERCRKWLLQGERCRPFLETVGPRMKLKRRQCEIALAFLDVCKGPGHYLTTADQLLRFKLIEEMRSEMDKWRLVRSS